MPRNQNEDTPATPGVVHERQRDALQVVRDVYRGTLYLREKAETYLPQFPREPDEAYRDRLKTVVLFNGFKRTVVGLTGMVFRKDPQFDDDVPDEIMGHTENIDQAGRALEVFARDVFEHGLRDGHSHIFVDMQAAPEGVETQADEEAVGLRPYWVNILKEDVLSFRATRIRGEHVLTQFVYRETVVRPEGDYAEKEVTRYRVYELVFAESTEDLDREEGTAVRWGIHEKREGGNKQERFVEVESGVMDISRIPLVTFYGNRTGFLESGPPLLDLALENLKHYQIRSDRDTGLHVTNNPVPVFTGIEADDVSMGSKMGIAIPSPEGDAKYMEPRGQGLSEAKDELRDIEQRMAALGLAMLQRDTRAAETAEARRIEKSETDASLSSAARSLQDALNEALGIHAEWMDMEDGGTVAINRDFEAQMLDPTTIQVLSGMVDRGKLSLETLWELLEEGEILPGGFDPEQEAARLAGAGLDLVDAVGDAAAELPGEGASEEVS